MLSGVKKILYNALSSCIIHWYVRRHTPIHTRTHTHIHTYTQPRTHIHTRRTIKENAWKTCWARVVSFSCLSSTPPRILGGVRSENWLNERRAYDSRIVQHSQNLLRAGSKRRESWKTRQVLSYQRGDRKVLYYGRFSLRLRLELESRTWFTRRSTNSLRSWYHYIMN